MARVKDFTWETPRSRGKKPPDTAARKRGSRQLSTEEAAAITVLDDIEQRLSRLEHETDQLMAHYGL